jgi:hypothetical protein
MSNYANIEFGRPFFILHKDPKKQDITVWRKDHAYENEPNDPNTVLRIFFHGENFWCNPPTDSNMETNAIKRINEYGFAYLTNPDEYIEGYKRCAWDEGDKYRQEYAKKFFEALS